TSIEHIRSGSAAETTSETWCAARAGVRAMTPFLVGLLPFALAIGVAAGASPLDDLVGWATGPILFSGSAQLSAIEMLGSGVGAVLTAKLRDRRSRTAGVVAGAVAIAAVAMPPGATTALAMVGGAIAAAAIERSTP